MRRVGILLTAALMVTVLLCGPALAGEKGEGDWQFDLAPLYFWGVSIDGDVGIGPVEQNLQVDFGDIWDNLEGIFTGHFEARKGGWGGIVDVSYMNLTPSETLPNGVKVGVDLKTTMVEVDGFYRIPRDAHAFDIIGGFRYTKQETDISITPPGLGGSGARKQ